jgi:dihydroflavonol-4-reductase
MNVLVTGATGHIGSNLVRELLKDGRQVRVLIREDRRGVEGLEVEMFKGNILDYPSLLRATQGIEVVYHLAASISIVGDRTGKVRRTNVEGTKNVIRVCREAGVRRLVHFGSIHAYSSQPVDQPIDEKRIPADSQAPVYDRTKAEGNRAVLESVQEGLDAVIVAPTAVIGPYDFKPSRMGSVLLKIRKHKLLALVGGGYNWADVRDVVRGAIQAEKSAPSGSQYLLSGQWCTVRELAESVHRVSGVKPPRFTSPLWLARAAAPFSEVLAKFHRQEPLLTTEAVNALKSHRMISAAKAEKELGYTHRPLDETIRDTMAWFEETGMLV